MTTATMTNISQLKKGDIVTQYGGKFLVVEEPSESQGHRPLSAHLTIAAGPTNCAIVKTVCVGGEVAGYFKEGVEWVLQGTVGGLFAVNHCVLAE